MDQTDAWMLGVGAFGIVFYLFSIYFNKTGDYQHHHRDDSHEKEA